MSNEANLKRPRMITKWLKKENTSQEVINGNQAIVFKNSLRICLEPIDHNIINKDKEQNDKNINSYLRRSDRNSQPKLQEDNPKVQTDLNIEDLPPILFNGKIICTCDFNECANICDTLLSEIENSKDQIIPIGFDLEWPFTFQTGSGKTALAQICLSENVCYLIHLYQFKKLPTSFILLLSHSRVKLVGVNIKNDVWKLTRDFKEFPGQKVVNDNCLDCGPYANTVLNRSCRWSLERLTAYLLQKRINKDRSVRNSKWHIYPLSNAQKIYAATDAYVSLLLYLTIYQQKALNKEENY